MPEPTVDAPAGGAAYAIRPGTAADLPVYRSILFHAVDWNLERTLPSFEEIIDHPGLARFHRGWGRPGDIAVVATYEGEPVGGAFFRLFTQDDHGHGFLDEDTPEIAIAVWPGHRGRGLGTRLLAALAEAARVAGIARLSLSVEQGNPAAQLYLRTGYALVAETDHDYVMVATTAPEPRGSAG